MIESLKKINEVINPNEKNNLIEFECNKKDIISIVKLLKDDNKLFFSQLLDITAVDYPSREFRFDIVYIATSDKSGGSRHPMNFSQKKKHMMKMGIPSSAIVKERQVYVPKKLMSKFDGETTAFVFGVFNFLISLSVIFHVLISTSAKIGFTLALITDARQDIIENEGRIISSSSFNSKVCIAKSRATEPFETATP